MIYYRDTEGNLQRIPLLPGTTQEKVLEVVNNQEVEKRDLAKMGWPEAASPLLAVI